MTGKRKHSGGPLADRRHERFALSLAELKTQEDSYKDAGYTPDAGNACRLAARPEIRARVAELQAETIRFQNVRRERIVGNLDMIASANVSDYYETVLEKGKKVERLKPFSKLTRAQTAAIASIDTDPKTGRPRVKLHDAIAANQTLLKFLGGLPEAPAAPTLNIFNVLPADDQRALADALQALAGAYVGPGGTASDEREQD